MRYLSIVFGFLVATALSGCGGNKGQGSSTAGEQMSDPELRGSGENFVNFESGQVRPLALSDAGDRLFVTNTPNATLDIFRVSNNGIELQHRVPVGLEPVAVAVRGESEAWVVNHLSDSVSVVDISVEPARVVKTLHTGDEPRDIVFAGDNNQLAFITAAHRGQNGVGDTPIDAQLATPGAGRADVWVFDTQATGTALGGTPISVVNMFGDTLRSLAVTSDGNHVYAAVMHSGNRTTVVGENGIAKSGPVQSSDGSIQPDTGLIVQYNGQRWVDENGSSADFNDTSYDSLVPFSLPDFDVFKIVANRSPQVVERYSGVGTTLFDMATNPVSGELYVSNTEALNVKRFEGPGQVASSLRGNFIRNRITIVSENQVLATELNKHLDRSKQSIAATARAMSMAQPMGMEVSDDGSKLYVAGFGSRQIAVYNTDELRDNSFSVSDAMFVKLTGGGPTGVVLDESRNRLYTLTRFNNHVAIVDTDTLIELESVPLFNPEPESIIAGREFLYAATDMSSHGDASCASCHIFGDTDALAWDLGNPDATVVSNPNEFVNNLLMPEGPPVFHPMKGPMSTQSLRGLSRAGPMHWRGDRTGQSGDGESLEMAAFEEFNVAFPELLGRRNELSELQMRQFAEFALTMTYPPNPIRALDNSLNESQRAGRDIYFNDLTTGLVFRCNDCHTLDPKNGHFGTSGKSSVEGPDISQEFKVPHLRNMYQKVGKFGNSGRFSSDTSDAGAQIRGFGFMHDGNMDTLDNFFKGSVFRFDPDPIVNSQRRTQVVDFVMAIDSDMAPIVGQQTTLSRQSLADTDARITLLMERANAQECDLIAKTVVNDNQRGYLYIETIGGFQSDRDETVSYQQLRINAKDGGNPVTFTCVPPGSGIWLGIDRNQDGVLDGES